MSGLQPQITTAFPLDSKYEAVTLVISCVYPRSTLNQLKLANYIARQRFILNRNNLKRLNLSWSLQSLPCYCHNHNMDVTFPTADTPYLLITRSYDCQGDVCDLCGL